MQSKQSKFLGFKVVGFGILCCLGVSFIAFLAFTYPFINESTKRSSLIELLGLVVQLAACIVIGKFLSDFSYKNLPIEKIENKMLTYKYIIVICLILFAIYFFIPKIHWRLSDFIMSIGLSAKDADDIINISDASMLKQFAIVNVINPLAVFTYIACYISYVIFMIRNRKLNKERNK